MIRTERKYVEILRILKEHREPVGAKRLSELMAERGFVLSDRAVQYYLSYLDSMGFTEKIGNQGRILTPAGLHESDSALVDNRIGFIISKLERLAYRSTFDPETGTLYVKVNDDPTLIFPDFTAADGSAPEVGPNDTSDVSLFLHHRIPVLKPPYAYLDALDLGTGRMRWQVPFGDNEALRRHAALQGARLPARLGAVGTAGVIVTRGGLVFAGGGDEAFHALDKRSGEELWAYPTTGLKTTGTPMTYRSAGRQYVVIAVGGPGSGAKLLAFAL